MKKIEISDTAKNAVNYEMDDGRIYRIHMDLLTPTASLPTADYVEVETRGYEIAKNGAFVVDDNGEPITLKTQRARIPLANFRAGIDTMKPGWVKQTLPEDEAAAAEAVKDARKLKKLPASAESGDKVVVGDELYAYSEGLYDAVRQQRLREVKPNTDAPAVLDESAIEGLIP